MLETGQIGECLKKLNDVIEVEYTLTNRQENTSFNWNSGVKKEKKIEEMLQSFDITGCLLEHKVCLQALYHILIEILAVEVTNDDIELLSSFHIGGYPYLFKLEVRSC